MTPIAIYLFKVVVISGLLYGYYAFALRNERFHGWNRYYLLSSVAVAIVIPLIHWSSFFSNYFTSEPQYVARLQIFTASPGAHSAHSPIYFSEQQWIEGAYMLIGLVLLMGSIASLFSIRSLIRNGKKKIFPLFTLVMNTKTIGPFSFFRYIFWPGNISVSSRSGRDMLRHELAHVQQKHSLDKLCLEIITSLFWINPFFFLIRRELNIIHEFIADRKACESTGPQEYATLLIEQTFQPRSFPLTSSFFQKQLSRRVHMLIRENKNHFTYIKRLTAIPIALFITFCFLYLQSYAGEKDTPLLQDIYLTKTESSVPATPTTKIQAALKIGKSQANDAIAKLPVDNNKPNTDNSSLDKVFTFVESMPSFPGGNQALSKYLQDHIQYPEVARQKNIQGTVVVQFIVGANGTIHDPISVGKSKGGGLEEEAIRVVKNMPKWIPGKQNGRKVTVRYNLPVRFMINNTQESSSEPSSSASNIVAPPPPPRNSQPNSSSADKVFSFVEQMPQFPGGEKKLMTFLSENTHYPAVAREDGLQGTVVVQFIVGNDGKLSSISTVGTHHGGGLEEEAVRVVKKMPLWIPGKQNSHKVAVLYNLPIRFVLQ